MSSLVGQDAQFGPQLPGRFDFTILFEHSMLGLVPTGIAILVTPFYLRHVRAQRQVLPGILLLAKLACGFTLVAIQAANIALWHNTDYFHSRITIAASVMSLIASICIMAIIFIAHAYALEPSAFLSIFFALTMLFDITMARSYFLRDTLGAIAALQLCIVLLKALLVILEEVPKRSLYRSEYMRSTVSAEAASGFWNRSFVVWVNPLLVYGWSNNFTTDSLPDIGDEFASEKLFDQFSVHWAEVDKSSSFALLFALLSTLKWKFAQIWLPRLSFIGFTLAQPLLLLRTVDEIGRAQYNGDIVGGLIGACAIIYVGLGTTRTLFEHWSYRLVTYIRGILVVAIYDKMFKLSAENLETSNAVTLMSTDVAGTERIISLAYESCACLIQVAFSMWILHSIIGAACFLVLPPTFLTFIGSILTGRAVAKARTAFNEETEKRVAATSNMLAQVKTIKAMGLSGAFEAYIAKKREAEINISMRERYTVLLVFASAAVNFTVTPAIVFAGAYFWTRADDPMSTAEVFAMLALLAVSVNPLMDLFRAITQWAGAYASIVRIETFLKQPETQNFRNSPNRDVESDNTEKRSSSSRRTQFAVQLKNVSVATRTSEYILQQVSMTIPWGALAMMWGPISCGKSTLLNLLLGEGELSAGSVEVGADTVAYCSQETWIPNRTILEVVIGDLPYIEGRYRAVIRACALDFDIAQMPDGDQTKTGSNGCNLSGGQRQRLGLARGSYAEKEIMVIDDLFSSVDPTTASEIFHRLLGPEGLVRQWACTVILTTNRLELMDYADQTYRFSKDGRVVLESKNDCDSSSVEGSSDNGSSDDDDADSTPPHTNSNEDNETPLVQAKEQDEELEKEVGDLSLYTYLFRSAGFFAISGWVALAAVAAVGEWMPVIYLRIWFGKYANNPYFFIGYAVLSVTSVLCTVFVSGYYFAFLFPRAAKGIHGRLLQSILCATPQYIGETDSGVLLNRFGQDISLITRRVILLANQFLITTFTVLIEIGMIAAGSPYSVPMMVAMIAVLCVIQYFYLRSSRQLRQLELEESAALFTEFTEASDGIHHIRSFGWQKQYCHRLYTALDRSQKPTYLLYCIQRWLTLSMDLNSAIASVILVSLALNYPHHTSQSAVGLAMLSLIGFSGTTSDYIQTWTSYETSLGAVRRIKGFEMKTPRERDTLDGPPMSPRWPEAGTIEFDDLCATYTSKDEVVHKAVNDFSFIIQAGQKVGLMGRTGSGKSTMLSAILRMVDFTGTIRIDGRNTQELPREALRSRITTITQDGLRIKASLRFNLYPYEGKQATEANMIAVLDRLGLWAKAQRHGGLDAQYSKIRFSAAEKQLVFIARAILHHMTLDTHVLLIDEATNTLALDTEADVQNLIYEFFADSTIIIVSHRMESFSRVDAVLEFSSGWIQKVYRRNSNGELVESV